MSSARSPYKDPLANWGAASICYLNYGDSPYTTFFQETLKLKKAMEGYNFSVLLKPETLPAWADLSEKDEKLADIKDRPARTNLLKYIIELAADGYAIDLFLFTHGWPEQFGAREGRLGSEDRISADDIADGLAPRETGFTRMPIRIVWGTNCYGQTLGKTWRSIGAKATAGARFVNFYPNSWGNFIADWNKGNVSFNDAVANADTDLMRTAAQTYIAMADAPAQKQKNRWAGCGFGQTVLGDDPCARDYFVSCWLAADEWQAGMSGKENMNYSSYMFRGGEKHITKNTRLTWD